MRRFSRNSIYVYIWSFLRSSRKAVTDGLFDNHSGLSSQVDRGQGTTDGYTKCVFPGDIMDFAFATDAAEHTLQVSLKKIHLCFPVCNVACREIQAGHRSFLTYGFCFFPCVGESR